MKVLILAHQLPPKGRSFGRLALEYGKLLQRSGIEVSVLTATALGGRPSRRWEGLETHQVLEMPFFAPAPHLQATLDAFRITRRVVEDSSLGSSPDVIMSFDWGAAVAASTLKRAFQKPLIHVYNGASEARGSTPGRETAWITEMEGWAADLADHVLVPSDSASQELRSRFPNLRTKITCVPTVATKPERSASVDRDEFRRTLANPDDVLGLFVGAGERRNGIDLFLGAIPEVLFKNPRLKLAFVGEPPKDPGLREQLGRAEKSGRLRALGEIGDTVLNAVMQVADFQIASSRYDPSGIGYWEASLLNLPVVSTPMRAASDARDAGCPVTISALPDPASLASAILDVAGSVRSSTVERSLDANDKRIESRASRSAEILSGVARAVGNGKGS